MNFERFFKLSYAITFISFTCQLAYCRTIKERSLSKMNGINLKPPRIFYYKVDADGTGGKAINAVATAFNEVIDMVAKNDYFK